MTLTQEYSLTLQSWRYCANARTRISFVRSQNHHIEEEWRKWDARIKIHYNVIKFHILESGSLSIWLCQSTLNPNDTPSTMVCHRRIMRTLFSSSLSIVSSQRIWRMHLSYESVFDLRSSIFYGNAAKVLNLERRVSFENWKKKINLQMYAPERQRKMQIKSPINQQ